MVMAKDVMLKPAFHDSHHGATYKVLEYGGEVVRSMSMDGRLNSVQYGRSRWGQKRYY